MNITTEMDAANRIVRIALAYCDAQDILSGRSTRPSTTGSGRPAAASPPAFWQTRRQ